MGYFPFSSNRQHKIKPDDLGFESEVKGQAKRLLDKNGDMKILRKGINNELFHHLVIMPLWQFLFWMLAFYLGINVLFAIVYFALGPASLGFPADMGAGEFFLSCLYFSAQTITTVGYGAINPVSHIANIIAALEALLGWVIFALITGLVYGRFSLPRSGIAFSRHAVINTKGKYDSLQCRLAGNMQGILMEVEARMMLSFVEKQENGEFKRAYIQLPLEIPKVYMLSLSWTLVHRIDEESALWGKTDEDLKTTKSEIMVMVKGENELYLQTIHAQTSYIAEEIIWNARFKNTHEINEDGETVFYLDRLDDHQKQ